MEKVFVIRYPEPPVPIPYSGRVSFGRAETSTIRLVELRVSRLHAFIEFRERRDQFVLLDLGSINGTALNGVKIQPTSEYPLKDRDKIRIASTVFTIRFVDDPRVIFNEFAQFNNKAQIVDTVVDVRMDSNVSTELGISGKLEHLCPIDLFQMLELGQKTGKLLIKTSTGTGSFTIYRGRIVAAAYGAAHGEKAVFDIIAFTKGLFAFIPQPESSIKERTTKSTTALLMEGCQLLDQQKSQGQSGSPPHI
ncbi:MAG: DUF4388 domain-containing protein [Chitinispirillaceae bacterium]|nr:DUF4388 domain-containing protein [Chitinispirillaceae bacterium]